MSKLISGPVNVVRLEGKMGSIKKVIYLFIDRHIPVNQQTECSDIFAKDVNSYFVDTFKEIKDSDVTYDLFMELDIDKLANPLSDSFVEGRDMYLFEMAKLFTKLFRFDNDSNKIKINEMFKNVRLHYLDIRLDLWMTYDQEDRLEFLYTEINPKAVETRLLK